MGPEPISEEGNYVLDDFDPQAGRQFNGVADSDVTDEDDNDGQFCSFYVTLSAHRFVDGKWANGHDYEHDIVLLRP